MKNKFKFNIQLFADENKSEDQSNDSNSESKEPNPYDDLIKGYQEREEVLKQENLKLKQQVKDYSDFLKSTPLRTEQVKKSSEELITNLVKGGRYNA